MIGDLLAVSAEHAFHMLKTKSQEERQWIADAPNSFGPGGAKSRGRRVTLRSDWDEPANPDSFGIGETSHTFWLVKDLCMLYVQRQKYTLPSLAAALLRTYDWELEEGNNHGDKYWGTVDGQGENRLGQILMQVRAELRVVYAFTETSNERKED